MSRRNEMLDVALAAFAEKGYDGTSIADLADATGLTKAAFSYHFESKDRILVELADPLICDLEQVVDEHRDAATTAEVRAMLEAYLDVLISHRAVVIWVDGDKGVASHPDIGARLKRNNRAVRRILVGGRRDRVSRIRASAVLGALWRPLRNLTDIDVSGHRDEILGAALEGYWQ